MTELLIPSTPQDWDAVRALLRDYAAQLGVEHYLGKPYSEENLLSLIAQCTASPITV